MHTLLELFKAFAHTRGLIDGAFVVGGAVRDLLMGKVLKDLDIVVKGDARQIAEEFAREAGASFVVLDADFGVYRLVGNGSILDLSAVRCNSLSIDLSERDLTINAMALPLWAIRETPPGESSPARSVVLNRIDPYNGAQDLSAGILRMVAEENFIKDPLRLLRVYRFAATLRFAVEERTLQAVKRLSPLISSVAAERVSEELRHILRAGASYFTVASMADSSILSSLLPQGKSMSPSEWEEVLSQYRKAEEIMQNPSLSFGGEGSFIADYFTSDFRRICVKLSLLSPCRERAGSTARHLKLSRKETDFLLALAAGKERLLRMKDTGEGRETIRLLKEAGDDIYALVLIAVAGSRDPSPYRELLSFYRTLFRKRRELLPLVTGHDLIREFRLVPSPLFRKILEEVEDKVLEGTLGTRDEALATVGKLIEEEGEKK